MLGLNGSGAANGHRTAGQQQDGTSNGNVNRINGVNSLRASFSHVDLDVIRLIGQHLRYLGLHRAAATLSEESGCSSDHPVATRLQHHVMHGQFDAAIADLAELEPFLIGSNANRKMKFLLLEHKFFEFLAVNKTIEALTCLRQQLSPLKYNAKRVHQLSSFLMIPSNGAELEPYRSNTPDIRDKLIGRLQKFFPANIMLPPRRLKSLLGKAQAYQLGKCDFHNTIDTLDEDGLLADVPLLGDHECDRSNLPGYTRQILNEHCDEIWACEFSNDGMKLATGSKDASVIIWDVDPKTQLLSPSRTLEGHTLGVSCISWSPDDKFLLVCGCEDSSDLWLWDVTSGVLKLKMNDSPDDSLTSCAWHSSGEKFVAGGVRGQFYLCNFNGSVLNNWEGIRVQCLHYLPDSDIVLASDNHRRIKAYNFATMTDELLVSEDHSIMTFTLDKTHHYALVHVVAQGLHLWDIKNKTLMMKYRGVKQGTYNIHSCFGGLDQRFIASGSEDHNVYIYHRKKETPVAVLEGHTRTVNSVAWNPKFHTMLVSASDDGSLRVWGPPGTSSQNNGVDMDESVMDDDENVDTSREIVAFV